MRYAKLISGTYLEYAPKDFTTPDGKLIANFNKSITDMKFYGYKEVIENELEHDKNTQYVNVVGYKETKDSIIALYEIYDLIIEEPKPSNDEKFILLYEEIQMLQSIVNDLMLNSMKE